MGEEKGREGKGTLRSNISIMTIKITRVITMHLLRF